MSIIISILIFGLVIFVHEFGHFVTAKLSGIKVNEFSIGMGPQILGFNKGGTEYSVRRLPLGGYVAMEGEDEDSEAEGSFSRAPAPTRFVVLVAGAVNNFILGFLVLCLLTSMDTAITSKKVSSFYEGARTQQTGLMVDDEIIAVNGRKCHIANDIIYEFARTQNGTADFTVIRNGVKTELKGVTFDTVTDEDGNKNLVIDFTVYPIQKTFFNVVDEAARWTLSIARLVFLSLVDLVTGRVAINQMSGPVGIVSVISESVSYGIDSVLMILAMITINLGVFNLIPFPALDGGKVFLLLLEMLRGKPINPKYELIINAAGMVVLLGFMAFVTFSDITKLII